MGELQPVVMSFDGLLEVIEKAEPASPPPPPKLYLNPLPLGIWRAMLGLQRRIEPAPVPYIGID